MRIIECEQRSADWFGCRLGIPTASQFCEIVTADGKPRKSKGRQTYLNELLIERLTRQPTGGSPTPAMQRGVELEPMARDWYVKQTGNAVREVGLILEDGGRWGCSPDGLCEGNGLEIKCPMNPTFMEIVTSGELPDDHLIQVQACLWITKLPRWDYVVYTDRRGMRPQIFPVFPNPHIHAALEICIPAFCDELDRAEKKMRGVGCGVPVDTPIDLSMMEECAFATMEEMYPFDI